MPEPKLGKSLGANGLTMLLDVRTPASLLHGSFVLGTDVEQGQACLAADGLAVKDAGEDRGTIDVDRCRTKLKVFGHTLKLDAHPAKLSQLGVPSSKSSPGIDGYGASGEGRLLCMEIRFGSTRFPVQKTASK